MADKNDPAADAKKQSDADTAAYYERVNSTQPTPTQEENDRAKIGFESLKELDDKEPDGSEEDTRSTVAGGAAGYSTRSTAPKK